MKRMRITFPMSQGSRSGWSRSGSMCRSTTRSWSMASVCWSESWAMSWNGYRSWSWASSWSRSFKYWSRR
jgi:hypothetical protein